jgi:hypothetical protein
MEFMRALLITFLMLSTFLGGQENPGDLPPEALSDFNPEASTENTDGQDSPATGVESPQGTGREFLIEKLDWMEPVYPQDFYSGSIFRREGSRGSKAQIESLLDLFLGDLSRKVLPENALHSDFRDVLIPSLSLFIENLTELSSYRLSDFTPDEGTAAVPVTFFGERSVTRGIIYVKVDGDRGWRIEDVQVDWSELEVFDQEKEPFRPGSYPGVIGPGIY